MNNNPGRKHRIAFKKNRDNRARQGDLTREADQARVDDDQAARLADLPSAERLSGKGSISRNRTVIAGQDEHGRLLRDIDPATCLRGRVLSATGLTSRVQVDDGTLFECTVRRVVRTMARESRNAVVAGDWVLFQKIDALTGVIERVESRRSVLARGSRWHQHVIVANVDQVVIIASAADPPLKPSLIDRFLISAAHGGTGALICINKADLVDPVALQPLIGLYGQLGCQVVLASATTGAGIPRLRHLLNGRQSVFAGQSGVGKSSLLNAVQPGLGLHTGAVSEWTHKGTHTTRRAELLPLESGGWVVDTPGIRQLTLWDIRPEEVEGYFSEFAPLVTWCRFPDCSHTHETGCRVKQAVASGLISRTRYQSYQRIHGNEEPIPELDDDPPAG